MASKFKKNDKVIVLTGREKGKLGKIKVVCSSGRAIVEGLNFVKKHCKPNTAANNPGGRIKKESSIHLSNLAIYNAITKKADRVGFRFKNEKKIRFLKSTDSIIE